MNLTYAEMQQALGISRAIQDYFRINYDKKTIGCTDIYEHLARCNLIRRDHHGGLHFREFLRKLKEEGFLTLIPQCIYTLSRSGNYEWSFIRMSDAKMNEIRNKHADARAARLHRPGHQN